MPLDRPNIDDQEFSPQVLERLFTLHVAEYDSLMNRCNYFIALHVGVWATVATLLVFIVQTWTNLHDDRLIWVGAAAVQALIHIWATLLEEQYLAVKYIERHLRTHVVASVIGLPPAGFWRYEGFLKALRPGESVWGEWIMPIILSIAFLWLVYWRWESTVANLPFIILNAALVIVLFLRTRNRAKMRATFGAS